MISSYVVTVQNILEVVLVVFGYGLQFGNIWRRFFFGHDWKLAWDAHQ